MAVVNAFLSIAAAMRIAHFALAGKSVLCLDGKGLPVQFAGEPRSYVRVSVTSHDHNGEVGTMRWKITLDQDDLMLAVATVISALAISLALI
jgi:hypothetical protein